MCCDENAHGLEKKTCFDEMSPDLKYNVSSSNLHHRQEEEPIDIKEMAPSLIHSDDTFDAANFNSTVHQHETPLHPKENDELTQDIGCFTITMMLRANSFNHTLSTREICSTEESLVIQSFTIPLSRFMRDSQLEIMFM